MSARNAPDALFVYGTLMRGECRHGVLHAHGVESVEPAEVTGKLYDLGDYPGMILGPGRGTVHGELVRLRHLDRALVELDGVEGFKGFGAGGSWFRRTVVRTRTADGSAHWAWAYVYDQPLGAAKRITSGDWRRR